MKLIKLNVLNLGANKREFRNHASLVFLFYSGLRKIVRCERTVIVNFSSCFQNRQKFKLACMFVFIYSLYTIETAFD